jgi:hypothetical protein
LDASFGLKGAIRIAKRLFKVLNRLPFDHLDEGSESYEREGQTRV